MLRQTYQPAKIILWLSKEQFPHPEDIPKTLRDREGELFEIRMVDGDIRSHKKYYYVNKKFPNSLIFLIDDDLYYPTDILERTMKAYHDNLGAIVCNYGYHINYDKDGRLLPYSSWLTEYRCSSKSDLFFGSGGGTLIDTSQLDPIATNVEIATELTPIADDIWLNAVVRYSNMRIIMLRNGLILPVHNKDNVRLASQNLWNNQNDVQLNRVISYFKESENKEVFSEKPS